MTPSKKYRVGMWICLVVAFGSLSVMFIALGAGLFNCPNANLSDIVIVPIGLFVAYIGGAITLRNLAKKYDEVTADIAEGRNILARWTYFDTEWSAFTELDYRIDKKQKYKGCWWLTVYFIFVTVILVLVYPNDENASTKYFLISIFPSMVILIWLVTLITLRLSYRHNKQIKGESIIASDALMFNGKTYAWNTPDKELIDVKYSEGQPPMLEFKYGKMVRRARSRYTVRVPVPYGKEENARDIIQFFTDALRPSGVILDKNLPL